MNSMTNIVVNSLLCYDLQCVYRLEKWKEDHASELLVWLDTITETEMLCSLATFSFNHPAYCFPSLNYKQEFSAVALAHPLIAEEECVSNNVQLDQGHAIMIITGANMAGKSTFLRSVGVNMVLAQSGAPVCARE